VGLYLRGFGEKMSKRKRAARPKRYLYKHPVNGKKVTRQRLWQLKQKKKGRCVICGERSKTYRCDACNKIHLRNQKKALAAAR